MVGDHIQVGDQAEYTTLFFLYSCLQAFSLVVLRMLLFTPSHLATLIVVQ